MAKHSATPYWWIRLFIKILPRALGFIVMALFLGWLMDLSTRQSQNGEPAGFWWGMTHGALMPTTLPALAAGRDVSIYAESNKGRLYNLGYTMGVNGCGLIFFGLVFLKPAEVYQKCRLSLKGLRRESENPIE